MAPQESLLLFVCRIFLLKEIKMSRGAAWAMLGVHPQPLLLQASALDYGSPLFYMITKAANSF